MIERQNHHGGAGAAFKFLANRVRSLNFHIFFNGKLFPDHFF